MKTQLRFNKFRLFWLTLGLGYCILAIKANAVPHTQTANDQQLLIESPPTILIQPVPQSFQDGNRPATFSVVATGSNLTYQWQLNEVNIYGATSATYTITYLEGIIYFGKRLRVIVSNSAGSIISKSIFISIWNFDPIPPQLVMPLYNCQTGAITFQTNRPPLAWAYYRAIGISGFSSNPNQTVEAELRADPKPIQLAATIDGVSGFIYHFDLAAACQVKANNQAPNTSGLRSQRIQQGRDSTILISNAFADPEGQPMYYTASGLPSGLTLTGNTIVGLTDEVGIFPVTIKAIDPGGLSAQATFSLTVTPASTSTPLRLLPPVYNCQTGKLTFLTTDGNNTATEYFAIGVTPWSTSPEQTIEAGLRADPKPITLYARQRYGLQASYVFNLPAACPGAARSATDLRTNELQVIALGNPVIGESIDVEVQGIQAAPLHIQISSSTGQLLTSQHIEQLNDTQRIRVFLGKSAGRYLLQFSTPTQQKVVKVVRQ